MKPLQNNFTTPEQAKRLLELGVPVDSADYYVHISECTKYNFDEKHEETYKKCEYGVIGGSGIFGNEIPARLHLSDGSPEYLPCWSVGRLMEIAHICSGSTLSYKEEAEELEKFKEEHKCETLIEAVILCIKDAISIGRLDFSKLDE